LEVGTTFYFWLPTYRSLKTAEPAQAAAS
jgi:hypothetical protein